MRSPFGRQERLRRQAADWVAKLQGPHDGRDRASFAEWYRASPDHAAAYDRIAALFEMAADLDPSVGASPAPDPVMPRTRTAPVRYAFAAVAVTLCTAGLALAVLGVRVPWTKSGAGTQQEVFIAGAGASRHVVLVDGSEVVLSPGSELDVMIDDSERKLRLGRGEGRFTVFRDGRPFVVLAQGTEVVARGTRFVVRLGEHGTLVELIEGRVEVSYATSPDGSGRRKAALAPGERLVVPGRAESRPASPETGGSLPHPGMIEFDDTRLAEAVAQVNRYADRPVRLADPALGEMRVTGAFRAGDARGFAEGAAVALDLEVEEGGDGTLSLKKRVRAARHP